MVLGLCWRLGRRFKVWIVIVVLLFQVLLRTWKLENLELQVFIASRLQPLKFDFQLKFSLVFDRVFALGIFDGRVGCGCTPLFQTPVSESTILNLRPGLALENF